jgi:GDA1/CD39 (nucleoside phosphatase) family
MPSMLSALRGCLKPACTSTCRRFKMVLVVCALTLQLVAADISMEMLPIAHGMIIDAGSGGSRMHVYQWEPRLFETLPPPISYPESKNAWTGRFSPGLSTYATHPQDVREHLEPLIEFAKEVLADEKEHWWKFPIYLKATGGMRQLPVQQRQEILKYVREYFFDAACPFYFEFDFARVISGEEEGIYGWAAINFIKGNLLFDSHGSGTANSNVTVGALDMGGASTQISFFRQDQDIMSNLFKLQVGGQKHWNVYSHSFLYFGSTSTRLRMQQDVVDISHGLPPATRARLLLESTLAVHDGSHSSNNSGSSSSAAPYDMLSIASDPRSTPVYSSSSSYEPQQVRIAAVAGSGNCFDDTDSDHDDGMIGSVAYVPAHPHDRVTRRLAEFNSGIEATNSAAVADKAEEYGSVKDRAAATAAGSPPKVFASSSSYDTLGTDEQQPDAVLAGDACMPQGATATFTAADGVTYTIASQPEGSNFEQCHGQVLPLLHKGLNTWCNFAHSGQCSIAGIYQPTLPLDHKYGQFYAFSGKQHSA